MCFSQSIYPELRSSNAKKLKKGALLEFFVRSGELTVSDQAEFMKNQFEKWKGVHDQVDDVCMLFVQIKR